MTNVNVPIGDWFRRSFDTYKANAKVLIPAGLLGLVSVIVPCWLLTKILPGQLLDLVVEYAGQAVFAGPIFAGLFLMVLRSYDGDSASVKVGDVFRGFDFFAPTFAFAFGLILIQALLFKVLSVVPGLGALLAAGATIVISVLCAFTIPLLVDQKCTLPDAIRSSVDKVKGAPFQYFIFFFLAGLAAACGVIALGVGVLLTLWFVDCAAVVAYRESFTPDTVAEPAPDASAESASAAAPPPPPPAAPESESGE